MQLECDIPTDKKQLCILETSTRSGFAGHSVGGCISPSFVDFIEKLSDGSKYFQLDRAIEVMKYVDTFVHGRDNREKIRAYLEGDQFCFICPGNACELYTERSRGSQKNTGEGVTCHNLDSPTQQLTLLSGFAVLCSMYDM